MLGTKGLFELLIGITKTFIVIVDTPHPLPVIARNKPSYAETDDEKQECAEKEGGGGVRMQMVKGDYHECVL